jgi:gamma-glutamyl phosphate reductase
MIGFIRRMFGNYTPEENKERGRKYAKEQLLGIGILTGNNADADAVIAYSLMREMKELQAAARTDVDKAYAEGIRDVLQDWLENKKDSREAQPV